MKSNYYVKFFTFLLWSMLLVNQAHARLCSDAMRHRITAIKTFYLAFVGIGWVSALIDTPEFNKKASEAESLDAATLLLDRSVEASQKNAANLIIDKFYSKLEKRYPRMKLGRDEVIDILNHLNLNGVKNGYCPRNIYQQRLANSFFPDEKASAYLENAAKHSQIDQDIINAKQIRDEKNRTTENLDYHELSDSDDEVIKKFLVR